MYNDEILYKRWYIKATIPTLDDLRIEKEITDLEYIQYFNPESNPTIGATCAACINFTIEGNVGYLNNILDFWYGYGEETKAWYKLGRFKVMEVEPEKNGLYVKCKAYDAMIYAFEKEYHCRILGEQFENGGAMPRSILQEITEQTGVLIDHTGLLDTYPILPEGAGENKTAILTYKCITPRPDGYTYRQIIGYIAALAGKNAIIDRSGTLCFEWYSGAKNTINTIGAERTYEDNEDNDTETQFEAGYIKCISRKTREDKTNYDITFTREIDQEASNTIAFENPYMTEPIMNGLKKEFLGFTAKKINIKFIGEFALKAGKYAFITYAGKEYKIPTMKITHNWDGGLTTTIEAFCETESQNEIDIKGPITQSIEKNSKIATNDTARYLSTPLGYSTDSQGNFKHKNNSKDEFFAIQNYNGKSKIKFLYESGYIDIDNDLIWTDRQEVVHGPIGFTEPNMIMNIVMKEIYGNAKLQTIALVSDRTVSGEYIYPYIIYDFWERTLKIIGKIYAREFVLGNERTNEKYFSIKADDDAGVICMNVELDGETNEPLFDISVNTKINAMGYEGDISYAIAKFEISNTREEISTNETMSETFGKIAKWLEDLKKIAFSGNYNDLYDRPAIPTKTSQLTNDSGFKTTDNDTWKSNTKNSEGYVAKGEGNVNKVWKTDANGNPAWRNETVFETSVTGVKGNSESTYRTGDVNITKGNIGLENVDNTADVNKNVASANVIKMPRVTKNVAYSPGANRLVCEEFSKDSEGLPSTQWYHILTGQGSDANYNTQLALGMTDTAMCYRNRQGGAWGEWKKIPLLTNGIYNEVLTISNTLRVGKPDNAPFGVELAYNNEGGNISWYDPNGVRWEIDSYNGNMRIFNYSTLKNFIIDKNGDASFPGHLNVIGALDVNGAIKSKGTSALYGGEKIKMWTDNEGGNLEITSANGNLVWQVDSYDNQRLRIYCFDKTENKNHFPINIVKDAVYVYRLNVGDNSQLGNMGVFKGDANIFYIGGKDAKVNNYPHLKVTQFSNSLQILPTQVNTCTFGHTTIPFESVTAKNIYNSSGLITSSDRNKKKDFSNITQKFADAIIDGLKPTSFKYIDGDSGRIHYGLVAQDVEQLLKELAIDNTDFAPLIKEYPKKEIKNEDGSISLETNYDAEPEYFLRYEGFTGLIIKYIQGLKQENTELKEKMSQMEDRLTALESKLNNI